MAVDTRDKRASVLGLALASLLVLPEPGTLDQPDRQHVAYSYRGITAEEIVVDSSLPSFTYEATWQQTKTYEATFQQTKTYEATLQTTKTYEAEWD